MPPSGSIWTEQRQQAPVNFTGELPADVPVVVVGAGVCGLVTAAMLCDHGIDVLVVEAGDGSESVSMRSSAKVSVLHELSAARIADRRGRRVAMEYIAANRFGFDWISDYVSSREVDCQWTQRDAITYVSNPSSFARLEAEAALLTSAGVDVAVDEQIDGSFDARRSITAPNQAQFDPAAFLDRLAADVSAATGTVMYGTRVRGITRGTRVEVETTAGTVTAGHVIVTTGLPFIDRGLHFARCEPQSSYVIACDVEAPPTPAMYLAADGVKRSIRTATTVDGTEVLLVGGEGHKTGQGGDTEQHYRTLAAWTNEHFGLRAVTHRFTAQDYMTGDHMPFAGPATPTDDAVLIATGMNKWGFTNAPAAAAINIAGIVGGERPSWAGAFNSNRLPITGLPTLVKANANVATRMVGGWAAALTKRSDPAPGEGHVRFDGMHPVAQSTTCADASVIGVDGKCPHLGASLVWNPAENTWDCPLHGSRFESDGRLLHGPAIDDLARRPQ